MSNSVTTFGLSYVCVPFLNVNEKDYQQMKEKKKSDSDFKKWIKLSYSHKKSSIVVTCVRKQKTTLDRFVGSNSYP